MRKLALLSLLAVLLCSCGNKGVVSDPASTSDNTKHAEDQKADESKPSDGAKAGDKAQTSDNKPTDEVKSDGAAKPSEDPKSVKSKPAEDQAK